jgi:hypothetical protein
VKEPGYTNEHYEWANDIDNLNITDPQMRLKTNTPWCGGILKPVSRYKTIKVYQGRNRRGLPARVDLNPQSLFRIEWNPILNKVEPRLINNVRRPYNGSPLLRITLANYNLQRIAQSIGTNFRQCMSLIVD